MPKFIGLVQSTPVNIDRHPIHKPSPMYLTTGGNGKPCVWFDWVRFSGLTL